MNKFKFTAGLIAAALAFRDKIEKAEQEEQVRLLKSGGDSDEAMEHGEEELYEQFDDYCRTVGIAADLKHNPNSPDLECIAALRANEPSFTLRAQDITAGIVVRNWADMQSLNPNTNTDSWRKIDKAVDIATEMDKYEDKKWAD